MNLTTHSPRGLSPHICIESMIQFFKPSLLLSRILDSNIWDTVSERKNKEQILVRVCTRVCHNHLFAFTKHDTKVDIYVLKAKNLFLSEKQPQFFKIRLHCFNKFTDEVLQNRTI